MTISDQQQPEETTPKEVTPEDVAQNDTAAHDSATSVNTESASATSESTADESMEDFASLFESQASSTMRLQAGQKVQGTIITISGENVFLDVGVKVDGVMERKDILEADGELKVGVGDTVEAWVVAVTAQEIRLSRSMSGSGVAALEEARDAGIPVDGKVTGTVKGGYSVEVLGKRAFCPGSQMEMTSDPESLVGSTFAFLITRIESNGRNIVVSRRALLDIQRQEFVEKLLETLKEGDTVEGRITRLATFGAFMEVAADVAPGVEGMIHISELAWSRVQNADEAVSPGDVIRAKVLSIAPAPKGGVRISLSRKQAEGDPWEDVETRLHAGDVVTGRVVRLTPFGAFVEVLPGIDGLVHISEMSWTKRVHKPEEFVAVADEVSVKIKEISFERRRLSLSMRDAEGDPWAQVGTQFTVGSMVTGTVESHASFGYFVNLAPGVTGLLAHAVIKNAPNPSDFSTLNVGQEVQLMVQAVDTVKRRISLAPEGTEPSSETERSERPARGDRPDRAERGERSDRGDRGARSSKNGSRYDKGDRSWKEHSKAGASKTGGGQDFGIMGQAFAEAMQKKK